MARVWRLDDGSRKSHRFLRCVLIAGVLSLPVLLLPSSARAEIPPAAGCKTAEALKRLGRLEAAEGAFLEELKTAPGLACATTGLEALERREAKCNIAKALAENGQKGKAEEAYVAVLKAKPNSRCAKAGLMSAESKSFFDEAKELGEEIAKWAALIGVALLVVTIPLLLLLRLLVVWGRTRHWSVLQKLLRLNVVVAPFDSGWMEHGLGPQFTSLFRGGFQPGPSHSLTTATGHAEIDEILKPLGEISAAKTPVAIASFLVAILPRLSYGISGALQPAGSRHQGVSVELTRGKRGVAIETFWGDEFETAGTVEGGDKKTGAGAEQKSPVDAAKKPDDSGAPGGDIDMFQELAVPAAAWAEYELAEDLGDTSNLRTSDSISWALFRAGAACQRRDMDKQAATLYRKALDRDTANAGALANLGFILWDEGKTGEAEVLLEKALREYENGKGIPRQTNPDWYRAKFNLASLRANLGAATLDESTQFDSARDAAKEIVELGLEEILRKPRKHASPGALRAIEDVVMASLTIYAATSAGQGGTPA